MAMPTVSVRPKDTGTRGDGEPAAHPSRSDVVFELQLQPAGVESRPRGGARPLGMRSSPEGYARLRVKHELDREIERVALALTVNGERTGVASSRLSAASRLPSSSAA